MKRVAIVLMLWSGIACAAPTPPPRTPRPPGSASGRLLERIIEAREVRLAKPMLFWRDKRQVASTSVVLLRVEVSDQRLFEPRGLPPPMFLYGKTVCETLRDPFGDREAVVVAPRPAAGDPAILWLGPIGFAPEHFDARLVKRHLPKESDVERGRALHVSPVRDSSGRVYRDVEDLRQDALRARER